MSTSTDSLRINSSAYSSRPVATNRLAFVLITSLFFMWGLSHGLLDVLNKHFQDSLGISHAQSALIQTSYFSAYFFVALPVGLLIERCGYRAGILTGLALFAIGSLLFLPASWGSSLAPFLFALFVLASGLACLETAANLYAATLGDPAKAEQRLTFAQSFNGFGAFIGPIVGGSIFFLPKFEVAGNSIEPVSLTYVVLAAVVVLMMVVFVRIRLPEVSVDESAEKIDGLCSGIWRKSNFLGALIAQFCFVGCYVGIGAFFINYALDHWPEMTPRNAAYVLSGGMLAYMIGRFSGTWIMRYVSARHLLIFNASMSSVLCAIAVIGIPRVSVIAVAGIYLFMSTLYPTIFAMGVRGMGKKTKRAGSILVMTLVGGAILPLVMGGLGDSYGTEIAFSVPMVCFIVISMYGLSQRPKKIA
ncbi:sugar MFS transporter [Pseudomonas juntendi]|uniref:sugar MFS transporter n=1 Tax=Pseudomonas juntendi TaxID=2666183 RepID=UPI003209AD1F